MVGLRPVLLQLLSLLLPIIIIGIFVLSFSSPAASMLLMPRQTIRLCLASNGTSTWKTSCFYCTPTAFTRVIPRCSTTGRLHNNLSIQEATCIRDACLSVLVGRKWIRIQFDFVELWQYDQRDRVPCTADKYIFLSKFWNKVSRYIQRL